MFEFLNDINLAPNEAKTASRPVGVKLSTVPDGADIRILSSGAVFPHFDLITEFDLEYRRKDAEGTGFGFDVIDSREWKNTRHLGAAFLLIAAAPKNAGNVDLFDKCRYDKNTGDPMVSVIEQGSNSYGTELLALLEEVYGITPGIKGYVDVKFVREKPLTLEDGVYYIPKKMTKGDGKGQYKTVKRENLTLFPLIPTDAEMKAKEEQASVDNLLSNAVAVAAASIEAPNEPAVNLDLFGGPIATPAAVSVPEPMEDDLLDELEPEHGDIDEDEDTNFDVNSLFGKN